MTRRRTSSRRNAAECVAHFEPPQAWNAGFVSADPLQRQRDRVVFVIKSPARSDGGVEHEGHQYLCPSCLAETSASTVILPVRCRNAFMLAIALSTSACRRCASGTIRAIARPMSGDDYGLPALDVIEGLGKVKSWPPRPEFRAWQDNREVAWSIRPVDLCGDAEKSSRGLAFRMSAPKALSNPASPLISGECLWETTAIVSDRWPAALVLANRPTPKSQVQRALRNLSWAPSDWTAGSSPPFANGGPPPSNCGLTRLTDEELDDRGRLVLKPSSGSPQSDGGQSSSG